jgi:hypothetical protein
MFSIYKTQLQSSRKHKIFSADWRNIPTLPSLRPDVVPLLYQQEISPVDISRRQFQYAVTVLQSGGTCRTPRISSGTQTNVLNIPITSQSRPVIIQSPADTQMSPQISCGEVVKISVYTQTIQPTNLVSAGDKGVDTGEVTNTVKTTESTQTDSLVQVSVEIQTEKLLKVTEISETDIPTELQISASSQTEDMCIKVEHSKDLGTPVSTQTVSLDMHTISTETGPIEVASEELLERTCVKPSNLEINSDIQKNISGSRYQPKPHLSPEYSAEENNSTPIAIVETDISLEEFTELKMSVGTQTVSSSPFPSTMVSPMRQFQFSITTVFPSGSLLSSSSPMRSLLMPLGMIFF